MLSTSRYCSQPDGACPKQFNEQVNIIAAVKNIFYVMSNKPTIVLRKLNWFSEFSRVQLTFYVFISALIS